LLLKKSRKACLISDEVIKYLTRIYYLKRSKIND
jgi:hypothetical protein